MAVFPDRILLKNSITSEQQLRDLIAKGSPYEIQAGELVIFRGEGFSKLFTRDQADNIVEVSNSYSLNPPNLDYVKAVWISNRDSLSVDYPEFQFRNTSSETPATDSPKYGDGYSRFDGTANERLQYRYADFKLGKDAFTLEFWFRTDDTDFSSGYWKPLIATDPTFGNEFIIAREPTGGATNTGNTNSRPGALVLNIRPGNVSTHLCGTAHGLIDDGEWHFVSFSHEGYGVYSCFVDGELMERRQYSSSGVDFDEIPHWNLGGYSFASDLGAWGDGGAGCRCDIDSLALYIGAPKYANRDEYNPPSSGAKEWAASYSIPTIGVIDDVITEGVPKSDGDALIWDEANGVWTPGTSGPQSIGGLVDVSFTDLVDNQYIQYNAALNQWINVSSLAYDISSNVLNDLSDVSTTTPVDGQVLAYDETSEQWVPTTLATSGGGANEFGDLLDASTAGSVKTLSDVDTFELSRSGQGDSFQEPKLQFSFGDRYWSTVLDLSGGAVGVGGSYFNPYLRVDVNTSSEDEGFLLGAEHRNGTARVPFFMGVKSGESLGFKLDSSLRLYHGDDHYVALQSPELTDSVTFVLPAADGLPGQYLTTDGNGALDWASELVPLPTGYINNETGLGDSPMHGPAIPYQATSDMEDDGFQSIEDALGADDSAVTFQVPAEFTNLPFGGLDDRRSTRTWFINPNGGIGYDRGGGVTQGRSGSILNDAGNIDFYVGLWSQDTSIRRAGQQTIETGGQYWHIIRVDWYMPANQVIDGLSTEVWISRTGDISVKYGTVSDPLFFLVSNNRNGIVSNGAYIAAMDLGTGNLSEFTGLTNFGQYVYSSIGYSDNGLGSLDDVDLTNPPSINNVLSFDVTAWVAKNPAYLGGGSEGGAQWINDLNDVNTAIIAPAIGDSLRWDGFQWTPRSVYVPSKINDLSDVDTATLPPEGGDGLVWNADLQLWEPGTPELPPIPLGDLSDVNLQTRVPEVNQALVFDGSEWIPGDPGKAIVVGGTGGQIAGTTYRVTTSVVSDVSDNGNGVFTEVGESGQFVSIQTDVDAWVVFYSSPGARAGDSGRTFGSDPSTSSGVLAEFYVAAGAPLLVTPATFYFNDESTPQEALYFSARESDSTPLAATVTLTAYGHHTFAGYGTNRATDSCLTTQGFGVLDGLGMSGQIISLTCAVDAWVTLYANASSRLADTPRTYGVDAEPSSGVIFDGFLTGDTPYRSTPGVPYANADFDPNQAVYVYVRSANGDPLGTTLSVTAYAETDYTAISGGTYGSG